jgi:hypothetical protein
MIHLYKFTIYIYRILSNQRQILCNENLRHFVNDVKQESKYISAEIITIDDKFSEHLSCINITAEQTWQKTFFKD